MPIADPDERRQYHREWIKARRASWLAGKACAKCGSTDRLQLDHVDPASKTSHRIWSWSEPKRLAALSKCQVLCYGCHRTKTDLVDRASKAAHGTRAKYKSDSACRCDACRAANARYEHLRRVARVA
jgi:5-methylcytosine-specific restriction endonuclease McrA